MKVIITEEKASTMKEKLHKMASLTEEMVNCFGECMESGDAEYYERGKRNKRRMRDDYDDRYEDDDDDSYVSRKSYRRGRY